MVSVCLPSDALLQHLSSYLGFSYLRRRVSLHGCSSKVQPLLFTLAEEYLLTAAPPNLERGIAPLGPLAPAQPRLLGQGVAPPGRRPWPRAGVAPLGYSCAVAAWHSRPPHLTSDTGNSSQPPPLGHGVLSASAPDRGRGVALGCALPAPCAPSQPPARCRSPLRAVAAEICDLQ